MANKEISELTAGIAMDGTELMHGVQGGNSRKFTALQLTPGKGASITSASTVTLGHIGFAHITGTTTITALSGSLPLVTLIFDGVLTLTHNSTSLILPGAANILTTAGDSASFVNEGAGNWRCVHYQRVGFSTVTLAPLVATTSGTSTDFPSIPPWVRQITVNFVTVSTSGGSPLLVQLGDSGGIENSQYLGTAGDLAGATVALLSNGFAFGTGSAASALCSGSLALTLEDAVSNAWCAAGSVGRSDAAQIYFTAGRKSLSAVLDRVRVTTMGGTDTFDGGSVNISYL